MTVKTPEALLVAVDFSPCSLRALDLALSWSSQTTELTVLHVLDRGFVGRLEELGVGRAEEALATLRARAEGELARLVAERQPRRIEPMIVVGEPFVEIVKLANDLDCDLIVIGMHAGDPSLEQILFGGTAQKVLRAARRPVLCAP